MKKTRYTEEQIAFALKAETGTRVVEVCRKMGISEATFYNWKTSAWLNNAFNVQKYPLSKLT